MQIKLVQVKIDPYTYYLFTTHTFVNPLMTRDPIPAFKLYNEQKLNNTCKHKVMLQLNFVQDIRLVLFSRHGQMSKVCNQSILLIVSLLIIKTSCVPMCRYNLIIYDFFSNYINISFPDSSLLTLQRTIYIYTNTIPKNSENLNAIWNSFSEI